MGREIWLYVLFEENVIVLKRESKYQIIEFQSVDGQPQCSGDTKGK